MNTKTPGRKAAGTTLLMAGLLTMGTASTSLAAPDDSEGFIYGRVTTDRGTEFVGRLRWGTEEAFWGDILNSTKEDRGIPREFMRRARRGSKKKRETIRIFGIPVGVRYREYSDGRAFKARFGDVERIDVEGGDRATIVMKNGGSHEVEGGSNDIGATISVWDDAVGEAEVDWSNIRSIEFLPTPAGLNTGGVFRLHGTVETDDGEFSGFIQWDQDEALSTDKLDGDTRDAELSLEMGRLASIEKRSAKSSRVTLRDGREFVLSDSNDVDDGNRGIFVEDPRYGRILVRWDGFRRVDFSEPGKSGPGYGSFGPAKALRGTVTDLGGRKVSGRIHYDLDESYSWEILDGNWRDIEYSIPFALIASIQPDGSDSSTVTLVSGEKLTLEDAVDVGDGNDGILVEVEEGRYTYIAWDDVDMIELSHR